MKKVYLQWKAWLTAFALLPATMIAQDYNNVHNFASDYERSAHTCAIQMRNERIVEGGTILHPESLSEKVVELGIVDPVTGTLTPHPYYFAHPGLHHTAADLTESLGDPDHTVVAANMGPNLFRSPNMVNIFKADPFNGNLVWSILYKNANGNQTAKAIASDREKSYFVVGNADIGSLKVLYLIKIKDDGTPLWERYYHTGNRADVLRGVDVGFDGNSVVVVADYSNEAVDPGERGLIISQIDPNTGFVTDARHLIHLKENQNLKARDLEIVNGRYVIVGEYNQNPFGIATPRLGFMVTYDNSLNVLATRIYGDPNGNNLIVTGVKPGIFGDLYMTFDLGTTARANFIPGIMQTTAAGAVISAEIYKNRGYLGTNGLIEVFGGRAYMIKGSTDANSVSGARSLNLIGQSIPLADNPATCSRLYEVKNDEIKYKSDRIELWVERDETANKIELKVSKVDGKTYDCEGNTIAAFRKAAPALANTDEVTKAFEIFPNPSTGNIAIQFNNGDAAAYQTGEVFNLLGEVVANFTITNTTTTLDLSSHTPGVYMIRLKSYDGKISEPQRVVIR